MTDCYRYHYCEKKRKRKKGEGRESYGKRKALRNVNQCEKDEI